MADAVSASMPVLADLADQADRFSQAAWEDAQFSAADVGRKVFAVAIDLQGCLDDLEIAISRLIDRPPTRKHR